MTADNTSENNGQASEGTATKTRARKASRKRSPASGQAAKRGKAAASGRGSRASGAQTASRSRSSRGGSRSSTAAESSGGIASRVLSRGRKAAAWAVEGASRAVPLASRSMPDQRMVQRLVDERPYMLGAIGLGIGAMIGLMLPGTLSSMSSRSSSRKSR